MTALDYGYIPKRIVGMERNADRVLVYKVILEGITMADYIPAEAMNSKYPKVQSYIYFLRIWWFFKKLIPSDSNCFWMIFMN